MDTKEFKASDIKGIVGEVFNSYTSSYFEYVDFARSLLLEQWIALVLVIVNLSILFVKANESSSHLLLYGKNQPKVITLVESNDMLSRVTKFFTKLTVPKVYFKHYYIYFSSLMLISQTILMNFQIKAWPGLNEVVTHLYTKWCSQERLTDSTFIYLSVVTKLLLIQSFRRLYENLFVVKFSKNRMNVLHYIFGLLFYTVVVMIPFIGLLGYYIDDRTVNYRISDLDMIDYFSFAIFGFYQLDQYQNHVHLAGLKKYSIPTFRFFELCSSAHYLDEILIYSTLLRFFITCDGNFWLKLNFLMVWVLVVLNLCISGGETHRFYQAKFKDQFKIPYRVIPNIY